MKLQFDPDLDYQREAIDAVIQLFEGTPSKQSDFEISFSAGLR